MFDSLSSQLGKLMGKKDEDPQSTITADQLKVVLKSIEGKYNNLKNENKLFKSKNEELKATVAELEKTISELKSGNAAGEASLLTQLEADLDAARTQLAEAREAQENFRNEKLQLQSKLSVQEALVASLRHELSELRDNAAGGATAEEHAKAIAELDKLRSENQKLQAKVAELAEKLMNAQEEGSDAEGLKEALDAAEKRLSTANEELRSLKSGSRKWESERGALMERMEALTDELDVLRDLKETFETAQTAHKSVVDSLKGQLSRAQESSSALEEDKNELAQKVQKQQAEIQRLEEQLASGGPQGTVVAELEERYVQSKARVEQLAAENKALHGRLQAMLDEPAGMGAREKTEMEFQIRRLTEELREAGVQISALREVKVKSSLDLEEAAAELVELRRQLDDMRRDRNFYRERWESVRESQGEVDSIKHQMRELMNEVGRLRGEPVPPPVTMAPPVREPAEPPSRTAPSRPAPLPTPVAESKPAGQSDASLARRRDLLNRLIGDK